MVQPPAPVAYPYPYGISAENFGPYQIASQSQTAIPYLYPYQDPHHGPATTAYPYPYESSLVEPVPRVYEPTYQNPAAKKSVPAPPKNAPRKFQKAIPITTIRIPVQTSKQGPSEPIHSVPPHSSMGDSGPIPTDQTKTTQDGEIDNIDSISSASNAKKTRCLDSKKVRIVLLLLILLLIVLAVIVPILVAVLLSRASTETATTAATSCARTYSQAFTTASSTASDCAAWRTFATGLTCSSYSKMRIYGTNDPTGVTITSSAVATAIATALRGNATYTATSNGCTWAVGLCGSGYEVTSTGSVCFCNSGYTIRPCILNSNWGGINGATCSAAAQTVSLYFE